MPPRPEPTRPPAQRIRAVLAEAARGGGTGHHDRTRVELAEQTRVGDALVRGLVRAQLALAVRLALVVGIGLGVLAYPFLAGAGWAYVHLAERNEADFTAVVQRPER